MEGTKPENSLPIYYIDAALLLEPNYYCCGAGGYCGMTMLFGVKGNISPSP